MCSLSRHFLLATTRLLLVPKQLPYSNCCNHKLNNSFFVTLNNLDSFTIIRKQQTMAVAAAAGQKVKIAVVQLNSTDDKDRNFSIASSLVQSAAQEGAKIAFLPECFDSVQPSIKLTIENGEYIDGPTVERYRELARQHKIWLSLGGLHERVQQADTDTDNRLFNAHIVLNDQGDIVSIYRKVHLFNLDIPGTRLVESEFSRPGTAVIKPVPTPAGKLGLGICYDLRFSEFAISLAKAGADILSYPSSFTVVTGKAHWETLLRARAIETQCYVVAAAQTGVHHKKRSSYGHSIIIDPWGVVLAQVTEDKPAFAIAEIDFNHLADMRKRLPVWTDRKPELYGLVVAAHVDGSPKKSHETYEQFQFGEKSIVEPYQIFAKTALSVAFVDHRPVLPGHVLVSPLRTNTKRLADLNQNELYDLFALVQKVQAAVEQEYSTNSSTIVIQDGIDAGQSIEHMHVHILPRKKSNFGGNVNEIYERLQQHKDGNQYNLPLLTVEEMTTLCETLKKYF